MTGKMDMTSGRELAGGIYDYDALEVGDCYWTGRIDVTEAHVVGFAGLSGDLFDVHMDEEFAQGHGFPARIAHGLLVLAMADGLKNRAAARIRAIASMGWTDWRFRHPVLIGDRIRARIMVAAKKPHRDPLRGILTLQLAVHNQHDLVVQEGLTLLLCERTGPVGSG